MAGPFFQRLRSYYLNVAAVLRGEASAAAIFPNKTDIGLSREQIYAEFLRQHAPSKCNVFFGGFLFGEEGEESSQLDVIVTTDTTPRFNFHNQDGNGKSFSPVEGTLGVAAIKTTLDKRELEDSLAGLATIPPTTSLNKRVTLGIKIKNYDDWPYKIIYASDGIAGPTLLSHLQNYYSQHPEIPLGRRPNLIHVSGKYVIIRMVGGVKTLYPPSAPSAATDLGTFHYCPYDPDVQGILWALHNLQQHAAASAHILFGYGNLICKVPTPPPFVQ